MYFVMLFSFSIHPFNNVQDKVHQAGTGSIRVVQERLAFWPGGDWWGARSSKHTLGFPCFLGKVSHVLGGVSLVPPT